MTLTRTIWKNSFTVENLPAWVCPTCNKCTLKGVKKDIKMLECASSKAARTEDGWDPEWVSGNFTGTLKCDNTFCAENVIVTGRMFVEAGQYYDEQNESWNIEYTENLYPEFFLPAIRIFQIHKDVPEEICKIINDSFKLFWIDPSSCGNKIRMVIELIMDDQKIPKTYITGSRRKGYSLHNRIELFKSSKHDEAELLMAIKWIGNSGSHSNEQLSKDDILDAYEILEHVTFTLYEKDSRRIKKLSKTINKQKKPISTNKRQKK
jgi:hypothetical protein